MPIDFPDEPIENQQFTSGQTTWFWTGTVWKLLITEGVQGIQGPTGPTGPVSTTPGPTGPTGPVSTAPGPTGPTGALSTTPGPTGPTGPTGPEQMNIDAGAANSVFGGGITIDGGGVLG